jgi:hypothetical protein
MLMKVKELREFIKNLPDDMLIVTAGRDHSYIMIQNADVYKIVSNGKIMSELYLDEENIVLEKGDKVQEVLIINP